MQGSALARKCSPRMGQIRFYSPETEIIKWQILGVEAEKMLTEAQASQYHEDSRVGGSINYDQTE